jgi:uncharacterized protein (TIGR02118 family)
MRKLVFLCSRRPDITHERYAELLVHGHIKVALVHHPALRKYVVNVVDNTFAPGPRELDSIGELSFASLADYRERLYDSPEGKVIVQRDVAGFMGGADAYECNEIVQREPKPHGPVADPAPPRSAGVKLILALKRKPDQSHQQFADYWLRVHAPLVLEHGAHLAKYVTNVVDSRLSDAGADWDGFAELHFSSQEEFAAHTAGHGSGHDPVREDTANFVGTMAVYLVSEYVAKLP